jgi:antitoxin YobK
MSNGDEIRGLIDKHSHVVQFANFGQGISEDRIVRAETMLGMPFPPTYKWWLKNYGGGEIGGEEIYSVYRQDFESSASGDIVAMYRMNCGNGLLLPSQIAVCHSDVDGLFYFDSSVNTPDGEYPVYSSATGTEYAVDFFEFLKKRIEISLG